MAQTICCLWGVGADNGPAVLGFGGVASLIALGGPGSELELQGLRIRGTAPGMNNGTGTQDLFFPLWPSIMIAPGSAVSDDP